MTTNHTPGPWTVDPTDMSFVIRGEGGSMLVCSMSWHQQKRKPHPFKEESATNARLIAAAPYLLAALEKHVEWVERDKDGAIDPGWDYDTMVGQYIRAAIARARGES
jgi:hypothetical protein